ncbi:MAG: hypothetical protein L0191_01725 [Acidobacteria bacterium]|nr:hypothetical protein [Acidobacteriota bacterium]
MQRTAEKLLTELEQIPTGTSADAKNRRIRTLERLVRLPLGREGRAADVLTEIARKLGPIEPEITLVSKCLRKALHSDGPVLDRLIRHVEERHRGAIQCGCRLLTSLGGTAQARLGRSLAKELLQWDVSDSITEVLVTALRQLTRPEAKRAVTEELSECLDSPDDLRIRHAVAILSSVGDKSVEAALVRVLTRLLDAYYGGQADTISKDLCSYFIKFRSRAAVPGLLRGIETRRHRCFAEAFGALCDSYPEVQAHVLRLARRASDVSVRLECMRSLAAMRRTMLRIKDLTRFVEDGDLKYDSWRADLRKVLLRNPKEAKPILLERLRRDDEVWSDFALEVLKQMRVPMEEVAEAVGKNPVTAIYEFFFGSEKEGLGLGPLWRGKAKLGEGVKGTTTRFEHLVRNLLACLGFGTLDVDPGRRAGVDTVAFPPTWSHVLLVGTTTGGVADDLEKLANTAKRVRAALGELAGKIEILPIVATSMAGETHPNDREYAWKNGIVILRESDIDHMMEWVNTNRSYKKFITYLEQKVGKGERPSLMEILESAGRRV